MWSRDHSQSNGFTKEKKTGNTVTSYVVVTHNNKQWARRHCTSRAHILFDVVKQSHTKEHTTPLCGYGGHCVHGHGTLMPWGRMIPHRHIVRMLPLTLTYTVHALINGSSFVHVPITLQDGYYPLCQYNKAYNNTHLHRDVYIHSYLYTTSSVTVIIIRLESIHGSGPGSDHTWIEVTSFNCDVHCMF